jgi:hypothetical protein
MLLRTPKDKTVIWSITFLVFCLTPLTIYLTEKVMIESRDFRLEGASADRMLIGWSVFLFLISPFPIIFINWSLKNYKEEISLFSFNTGRFWWSIFWSLFFGVWICAESVFTIGIFKQFYFPEAFQIITLSLLIYLLLCLRALVVSKEKNFKIDLLMSCVALLFFTVLHLLLFS